MAEIDGALFGGLQSFVSTMLGHPLIRAAQLMIGRVFEDLGPPQSPFPQAELQTSQ